MNKFWLWMKNKEYVDIYNINTTKQALIGYMLEYVLETKHHYMDYGVVCDIDDLYNCIKRDIEE